MHIWRSTRVVSLEICAQSLPSAYLAFWMQLLHCVWRCTFTRVWTLLYIISLSAPPWLYCTMYPISLHCKVYADSSKVYQRRLYRFSATQWCNLKAAIVHLLFLSLLSMFGVEAKNMCKPKILVNVGSPQHTLYSSRHYTGCHLHLLSCILLNRITFLASAVLLQYICSIL